MMLQIIALALVASAHGLCSNPEVSSEGFTTANGELFSETAVTAKFSLKCDGKAVTGAALTSVVEGTVVPVATSADGSSYQASYFAANSAAGSGTYTFQVSEVGSDATFPVYSHHGGAGSNPLPFGTEYIILAVMGYVVFFASNNPQ